MHHEDWHARLETWRRLHIARMASDAEHTEAVIEQERELLESIRGLQPAVELDKLIDAIEAEPPLPRVDLRALASDLDAMIEERMPWHRHDVPPPRLDADDLESDGEREPLPYTLEATAGSYELQAATLRTTAAMVRVRSAIGRRLEGER